MGWERHTRRRRKDNNILHLFWINSNNSNSLIRFINFRIRISSSNSRYINFSNVRVTTLQINLLLRVIVVYL
jgi:hypothetical protein